MDLIINLLLLAAGFVLLIKGADLSCAGSYNRSDYRGYGN